MLGSICVLHTALLAAILVTYIPTSTHAHGRLLEPPSRMSAWRFGFNVPKNYEDHQQYCGGFNNQWVVNKGKCGICGDPWQGPRNYERPNGRMVQNLVITKTYKAESVIDVQVEVTVNHLGWFEFRLCDVRQSGGVEATQACLDKHLMADRRGETRFDIGTKKGMIKFRLVLPPGLTCPQCVMQWKWHCGNNVGYGEKQEEFYGCSDIAITPSSGAVIPPTVTNPPVVVTNPPFVVTNPPFVVTNPPFVVTNPPFVVTNPPFVVTNPPFVVTTRPPIPPRVTPTREIITNPPIVTLPPDLLAKLGDKRRPLAERIKEYANYQKTRIPGYDVWEAGQITFRQRYRPSYLGGFIGNNDNTVYPSNNVNTAYTSTNDNSNTFFCRTCSIRCVYHDCTRLCPAQCPTG